MKKVIVFLKNRNDGSSYYRLYQYLEHTDCKTVDGVSTPTYKWYYSGSGKYLFVKRAIMGCENIIRVSIALLWDKLVWQSNIVIINRRLYPRKIPLFAQILLRWYLNGKELFWDFDDNIIYDGEITHIEAEVLEEYSKRIIVTNDELKQTIKNQYLSKVKLLPTTDMAIENYNKTFAESQRRHYFEQEIHLIWVGTRNNLLYLKDIVPILDEAARMLTKESKQLKLQVICNQRLEMGTNKLIIENIVWTRERTLHELEKAHIGLMPLEDNEYTRGKGGFKAIQYIGMGIPSLVSDVGFNNRVVENGYNGFLCKVDTDWLNGLLQLCNDWATWLNFSKNAREKWENNFNCQKQEEFWKSVISER